MKSDFLIIFLSIFVISNVLITTEGFSSLSKAAGITYPIAADSISGTPFAVRVVAAGIESMDTTYEFAVWVYDKKGHHYISKIWIPNELRWASGWTVYQPFYSNTGCTRINWAYLKIYRAHSPDSFYICFKFRNGEAQDIKVEYPYFQILNMGEEGGWLAGTVYEDSLLSTMYSNVNIVAKNPEGGVIGAYVTEENEIDEGNPDIPGYFCIAAPVGTVNSLEFQDMAGNSVVGYVGRSSPWEITPGETTYVDLLSIQSVSFNPESPEMGDAVTISILLYNPGETLYNIEVVADYNKAGKNGHIGSVLIDSLLSKSYSSVEIVWESPYEDNYKIEVQAIGENFRTRIIKYLKVGEPLGSIIFNEIMHKPIDSSEWIEILNRSDSTINIKNWTIEDPKTKSIITSEDYLLQSNELAIISEVADSILYSTYGTFSGKVFNLGAQFPNLNNTGDTITLKNTAAIIQDVVRYENSWGNGEQGISLERINPNIKTNDPNNWGSCVTSKGATPGKTNSIYIKYTPQEAKLSVYPQIFSPENPDSNATFISYTLPFTNANVKLYIYDRCGRCVCKLINGTPSGRQSSFINEQGEITWTNVWNGKNDDGELLPIGIYIVYLEAKDRDSDALICNKTTVVLAKRLSR